MNETDESDVIKPGELFEWTGTQFIRRDDLRSFADDDQPIQHVPGKVVGKVLVTPLSVCPECGQFRGYGHEDVCPMAWVEITDADHVLRKHIDSFRYSNGKWEEVDQIAGETLRQNSFQKCRCRRKYLPPVPQVTVDTTEKKRTPIRMFALRDVILGLDHYQAVAIVTAGEVHAEINNYVEIKHDGDGFFVEE